MRSSRTGLRWARFDDDGAPPVPRRLRELRTPRASSTRGLSVTRTGTKSAARPPQADQEQDGGALQLGPRAVSPWHHQHARSLLMPRGLGSASRNSRHLGVDCVFRCRCAARPRSGSAVPSSLSAGCCQPERRRRGCRACLERDCQQDEVVTAGHGEDGYIRVHVPEPGDVHLAPAGGELMGDVAEGVHLECYPAGPPGPWAELGSASAGSPPRRPGDAATTAVDASDPSTWGSRLSRARRARA